MSDAGYLLRRRSPWPVVVMDDERFVAAGIAVVVPSAEGLQYTTRDHKLHYTARQHSLHYTVDHNS